MIQFIGGFFFSAKFGPGFMFLKGKLDEWRLRNGIVGT
jgi:hypothetical protein